ncbi:peptidoglycan-associated lipoprotein Pal [Marinicellulosiphila megalodicopiae]|uniref:peptidoglycan-associated lipoprotein Pal n=1 Tax=Marinicellulosiphila megalodicopiae TaxID=2724896 RepID=UPI003BAE340B
MNKNLLIKAIALTAVVTISSCGGKSVKEDTTGTTGGFTQPTTPVTDMKDDMKDDMSGMGDLVMDDAADAMDNMEDKASMLMDQIKDQMTVYFYFDQSTVTAAARESLDLHAKYLTMNPMQQIVLEGHADERGTPEYNLGLSERRANAVAAYLRLQGVNKTQISVVGMGEEMPADFGTTEAAYGKNRRVEIKYQ